MSSFSFGNFGGGSSSFAAPATTSAATSSVVSRSSVLSSCPANIASVMTETENYIRSQSVTCEHINTFRSAHAADFADFGDVSVTALSVTLSSVMTEMARANNELAKLSRQCAITGADCEETQRTVKRIVNKSHAASDLLFLPSQFDWRHVSQLTDGVSDAVAAAAALSDFLDAVAVANDMSVSKLLAVLHAQQNLIVAAAATAHKTRERIDTLTSQYVAAYGSKAQRTMQRLAKRTTPVMMIQPPLNSQPPALSAMHIAALSQPQQQQQQQPQQQPFSFTQTAPQTTAQQTSSLFPSQPSAQPTFSLNFANTNAGTNTATNTSTLTGFGSTLGSSLGGTSLGGGLGSSLSSGLGSLGNSFGSTVGSTFGNVANRNTTITRPSMSRTLSRR